MDNRMPRPAATQELALWIAGALFTLSCFGFLLLLRDELRASGRLLFGLFQVSFVDSVVYLLLAVGVLLSAGSLRDCRRLLAISGVAMIALALYGWLDGTPVLPALVPTTAPDTWLHLVLGGAMLAAIAVRRTAIPLTAFAWQRSRRRSAVAGAGTWDSSSDS
ncbi:DUF4383 domain-containing protein [Kribbella sp. HUAS MG21]|uniref:DUF4383 domain-containing protein n=1 Tax=Kribbella sp. HUAS MG21 TaxID=3160966 RepID=A0AAU7T647_9ACTN